MIFCWPVPWFIPISGTPVSRRRAESRKLSCVGPISGKSSCGTFIDEYRSRESLSMSTFHILDLDSARQSGNITGASRRPKGVYNYASGLE